MKKIQTLLAFVVIATNDAKSPARMGPGSSFNKKPSKPNLRSAFSSFSEDGTATEGESLQRIPHSTATTASSSKLVTGDSEAKESRILSEDGTATEGVSSTEPQSLEDGDKPGLVCTFFVWARYIFSALVFMFIALLLVFALKKLRGDPTPRWPTFLTNFRKKYIFRAGVVVAFLLVVVAYNGDTCQRISVPEAEAGILSKGLDHAQTQVENTSTNHDMPNREIEISSIPQGSEEANPLLSELEEDILDHAQTQVENTSTNHDMPNREIEISSIPQGSEEDMLLDGAQNPRYFSTFEEFLGNKDNQSFGLLQDAHNHLINLKQDVIANEDGATSPLLDGVQNPHFSTFEEFLANNDNQSFYLLQDAHHQFSNSGESIDLHFSNFEGFLANEGNKSAEMLNEWALILAESIHLP